MFIKIDLTLMIWSAIENVSNEKEKIATRQNKVFDGIGVQ